MVEVMTRVDVLRLLTACPVCGKPLALFQVFGPAGRSASARFECGSAFATYENLPIDPSRVCPGPGKVAAEALERDFEGRKA